MVVSAGVALACGGKGDHRDGSGSAGHGGATGRGGAGGRAGIAGAPIHGGAGEGADAGAAGDSMSGAGGGSAGAAEGGSSGVAGTGATDAGAGGQSGEAGVGGTPGPVVDLPPGSRERAGVVNLVDADAAAEVDNFLLGTRPTRSPAVNLFLKYYVEQYDFIYFFTDHKVNTQVYGAYILVSETEKPGTGIDYDIESAGYTTNGRTKGAIAVQYEPGAYGPLVHEMMHYWGIYLSPEFGFGIGLNGAGLGEGQVAASHWGFAGVPGVMGGFDPTTLHCQTPAGALPPGCTPETNGRYRYRVGDFDPNGNNGKPFAPFELYLMGLLSPSELPASIPVLTKGELVANTYDAATNTLEVEASGVDTVETSAIIARQGSVPPLPASERAFTAAFVVISATPVADSVLDDVGERAKNHGGRPSSVTLNPSFSASTGGSATLDTRLGPRRPVGEAPPAVRVPHTCDLYAQDCGAGRACYFLREAAYCGTVRAAGKQDEPCTQLSDCAAGLGCAQNQTSGRQACEPYCSPNGADPSSCFTHCDSAYYLTDANNLIATGTCEPSP